jgi:hypothetical protein
MRACLERRDLLLASILAAASVPPHASRASELLPPIDEVEDTLINLLQAGAPAGTLLTRAQASKAEMLVAALEADGGEQLLANEGIGSWGSWIGSWDVRYVGQSGFIGGPLFPGVTKFQPGQPEVRPRLRSARQFVFGPTDTAADLRGIGRDGSLSTELTYALDGGTELLLTRSGSFTKLPKYAYRTEYVQPARRLLMPGATPLAVDTLGVFNPAGGASLREISYLSEKLWISRSNDDGGLLVLQRTDARALAPPEERPDLTATCAEAVFVRGKVCRTTPLF